jgi:branched-chain amino acid transport system ATP-binding protein
MLKLENLVVARGNVAVIKGIDLEVDQGEIVALMGSNGVGKTTTLRTVSGLLRVRDGTITFDGSSITRLSPAAIVKRGIAHVPEGRQIFPALTVRENLEMGGYVRARDWKGELDSVLELFPMLSRDLERRAGSLSGGQQQMLAIGRALMSRPSLLMLDEPSIGLAPLVVQAVADALTEIGRRNAAVLLVEQNVGMALGIATRGYVMAAGKIVLKGSTEELRDNSAVRQAYLGI